MWAILPDLKRNLWLRTRPATLSLNRPAQTFPFLVLPLVATHLSDTMTLPFLIDTVFGAAWIAM